MTDYFTASGMDYVDLMCLVSLFVTLLVALGLLVFIRTNTDTDSQPFIPSELSSTINDDSQVQGSNRQQRTSGSLAGRYFSEKPSQY